jgi:DNA polymerase-3 subunit epsilon
MTGLRMRSATVLIPAAALAVVALALGVAWADLAPDERQTLGALMTPPRIGLFALFAVVLAAVLGLVAYRLWAPASAAARRMAETAGLVAHGNPAYRLPPDDLPTPELRAVADAVNALAAERSKLLEDVATTVAEANARVEEERKRLAALVAELEQSVLVCNREGRVLLYNAAAEALFVTAQASGASERLGLGRSVFGIIDRAVIQHALEAMECQGARDERESTHFVTATAEGRLLRVRVGPVPGAGEAPAGGRELAGYVLLLADVTENVDADTKRVALFQGLVEQTRAALANIRAAIENLTEHPAMTDARRAQFGAIIRDEAVRLSERLHHVTAEVSEGLRAGWPLEEMRGEDLLTLVRSRIARRAGLAARLEAVAPALWLRVDSFSLAQGLSYVARRLKDEYGVREVRVALTQAAGHAQLDVLWQGPPMSSETAFAWQSEPFTEGGEDSGLTLAQVVERHGGEAWYQRDVPTQTAYFRLLLPLAGASGVQRARSAVPSRPEFYDFDLFRRSPATDALDDRALGDLAYTVFDTETTGLNPAEGDEIIAIGAVRIVNGRLLHGETFESLVDPRRSLGAASAAVHGITPEMLRGQPSIETVLPRFRRFVEDTVLVGHNAAFDMRFLQRNEPRTGIRFEQPVLDTLLLSAVVHPAQPSHSLEEIAAQVGVPVVGRHTALGDALLTAEVFLRLLPLLAARGIRTLAQARAAAEKTYYARLEY